MRTCNSVLDCIQVLRIVKIVSLFVYNKLLFDEAIRYSVKVRPGDEYGYRISQKTRYMTIAVCRRGAA